MSAADTWMPLYVADFLADTTHLSTFETGAYLLVLMGAWVRGGKLPNDDVMLARIARCSAPEWTALRPVLEPFFEITAAHWVQRRLLIEKEKAIRRCAIRSAVGKLGGRPKQLPDAETNSLSNSQSNRFGGGVGVAVPLGSVPEGGAGEGFAAVPTLEEVIGVGSVTGVSEVSCRKFFDHYEGNNLWLNQHGQLMKWQHKLKVWGERDRAAQSGNGAPARKPFISELQAQLRATEALISSHVANNQSEFYRSPTDAQKAELRSLRQQVNKLTSQIANHE